MKNISNSKNILTSFVLVFILILMLTSAAFSQEKSAAELAVLGAESMKQKEYERPWNISGRLLKPGIRTRSFIWEGYIITALPFRQIRKKQ